MASVATTHKCCVRKKEGVAGEAGAYICRSWFKIPEQTESITSLTRSGMQLILKHATNSEALLNDAVT
jgi:hypothetical protein